MIRRSIYDIYYIYSMNYNHKNAMTIYNDGTQSCGQTSRKLLLSGGFQTILTVFIDLLDQFLQDLLVEGLT